MGSLHRVRERADRPSGHHPAARTRVLGLLSALLAMVGLIFVAPAASAAEAPPIPDEIRVFHVGYMDVFYQRPWVQRTWKVTADIDGALPSIVSTLTCAKLPPGGQSDICGAIVEAGFRKTGIGELQAAYKKDVCMRVRYYAYAAYGGQDAVADPKYCLRKVSGSIGVKWMDYGGSKGSLGYATTDELSTPGNTGRYNHFLNGSIYWSSATGAHEIHGAIKNKWSSMGWETSILGFLTSDELSTPVKTGRFNTFQHGIIYWSPATEAHEVHGSILAQYAEIGYENSRLGFPTTDEFALPGGGRQEYFQNGCRIEWRPGSPGRGTVVICNG